MMAETRVFLRLSKQLINGRADSTDQMSNYLTNIIKSRTKLPMSAEIRKVIPDLGKIENGALVELLTNSIDGITPLHFYPDLTFSPKPPSTPAKSPKSARRCQTMRNDLKIVDIKGFMKMRPDFNSTEAKKPQTSRDYMHRSYASEKIQPPSLLMTATTFDRTRPPAYLRPLPPLKRTDNDIISQLYAGPETNFFLGQKAQIHNNQIIENHGTDDNLRIVPPEVPLHKIGKTYSIITNRGIVSLEGQNSEITDLPQYVKDKSDFYLTKHNLFAQRVRYHTFYVWINRYKIHHFDSKIRALDNKYATFGPGFRSTLDKVRGNFLNVTEELSIFPSTFDVKIEDAEFTEMKEIAKNSVEKLSEQTKNLVEESARILAQFFNEIELTKEMMKLNFEELHELDVLPENLTMFISDLKFKTPSLFRNHLREEEMKRERQLAKRREKYLSTFYKKARSLYGGLLLIRCRETLIEFLRRFDATVFLEHRALKFMATLDENQNIQVIPSCNEFIDWITLICNKIKESFLTEENQIPFDLITQIDKNYNCESENLSNLLLRFKDIPQIVENVKTSVVNAYQFFDSEFNDHRRFLTMLFQTIEQSRQFTELRDTEKFKEIVNILTTCKSDLESKPRNIYHKITRLSEHRVDFIADMKKTWEQTTKLLDNAMKELKERAMNELNNTLYVEITDRFNRIKEKKKKLQKIDIGAFEARCLIYSLMCVNLLTGWPETVTELRLGLDSVSQMYQQIANITKYTHSDCAENFNVNAEKLNVPWVKVQDGEEEEFPDEEDEYEYVDEEET